MSVNEVVVLVLGGLLVAALFALYISRSERNSAVSERDIQIAKLQAQVANLQAAKAVKGMDDVDLLNDATRNPVVSIAPGATGQGGNGSKSNT